MKKNFITGFTTLLLSVSLLAGCGNKKPVNPDEGGENKAPVVTIGQINSIADGDEWVSRLDGQKVRLENVDIFASYADTAFVHQLNRENKEQTTEEIAMEITSDKVDLSEFTVASTVNVEGTVSAKGGRIILADSEVEIVKESIDGSLADSQVFISGAPVDRASLTLGFTKKMSGIGVAPRFQLVEDVNGIDATGKTIKVVMPGESLENVPTNKSIMDFVVPAGLPLNELNRINNNYFGNLKKGDCFQTCAVLQYADHGKWQFLYPPYTGSAEYMFNTKVSQPLVYTTYQAFMDEMVPTLVSKEGVDIFPNLTANSSVGESLVDTYVIDDSQWVKGIYNLTLTINTPKINDTIKALDEKLKADGYVGGREITSEDGAKNRTYELKDGKNILYRVVIQNYFKVIIASIEECKYAIEPEAKIEGTDFNAMIPTFNQNVKKAVRSVDMFTPMGNNFATKLVDYTPYFTKHNLTVPKITYDRTSEMAFASEGFALFLEEDIFYEVEIPYTTEKDPKTGDWEIKITEEEDINRYFRAEREIVRELESKDFAYAENTLLGFSDSDEKMRCWYNKETSEALYFGLMNPAEVDKETKAPIGNFRFIILDFIINQGVGFDIMEDLPDEAPIKFWPEERVQALFRTETGRPNAVFPSIPFEIFDMLLEPLPTGGGISIILIPDTKDPIGEYKAKLEDLGFEITVAKDTFTLIDGTTIDADVYTALNKDKLLVIFYLIENTMFIQSGFSAR